MIKLMTIYLLGFSNTGIKTNIDPRASLFVIFVLLVCLIGHDGKSWFHGTKDKL